MEYKDNIQWYEIAVDIVPDINNKRHNRFYVSVSLWTEWEEFGNKRYSYDPFVGNYVNRQEFFKITNERNDIQHIIIADTILDLDIALELEENLVKGFRSCEEEHGFNKKAGE